VINKPAVIGRLKQHYPALEEVSDVVLRGIDFYEGHPYAIRYFDLSDDIVSVASRLGDYQERILATSYFDPHSKADSSAVKAKALIEADREYARKVVLTEFELGQVLDVRARGESEESLPPDPITEWVKTLELHDLGFVVDEALQVPAVVRHIAKGERQGVRRPPAPPELSEAERQVGYDAIRSLSIKHFRRYPLRKDYDFGVVNLIMGVNGVGKTSLLEAIEYLFCGRVRRSDGSPDNASVAAVLAKSGLELETKTSTPAAKLRSRHLAWYGKADVRAVTLDTSFGKFNFLDTDAAARLTVEQSQERIDADLAQLLLGAEAAKVLVRFERLTKGLIEMKRDLERDVEIRDQRRLDATARLQELRSAPQESDQLFRDLAKTLDTVGWRNGPSDKNGAESVSGAVQSALVNIGVLKAAGSAVPRDREALATARTRLAQGTEAARLILDRRRSLEQAEAQVTRDLRTRDARADGVARLLPMLDAGLDNIAKDLDKKRARVTALAAALKDAEPACRTVAELDTLLNASVRRGLEDHRQQVEQRTAELNNARRALEAFERTQATLTNLAQQLRSVARQIVDHTHDETHCPLCATTLERADLEARLHEGIQSIAGDEAKRLRQQVQDAEVAHQQATAVLQALRVLSEYQAEAPSSRTTVRALLTRIEADRGELLKLQADLDALRLRIQEHEKRGWTLEGLAALARQVGLGPPDLNRDSVDLLNATLTNQRIQHQEALTKSRQDRQNSDDALNELVRDLGLRSTDAVQLLAELSEKASITDQTARALSALEEYIRLESAPSDLELEAQLREAKEAAVRVHTAVSRERAVNETIAKESKVAKEATAEVDALRVQVGRVESALNVVSDLIEKQSGRALTNQVLRENGAQIAATFGRIHAPSEFDVEVDEGGLRILRRSTKTNVDLHEMSSGQRAAFTLSLFLAMNGRLRTGPTAIIFDDPVAHVDDINTLSFIDHLRDIALEGERQIFFATADSKLAGLFARKFRFMGDQFRQIELARE
jgi:exonuclease SbcC